MPLIVALGRKKNQNQILLEQYMTDDEYEIELEKIRSENRLLLLVFEASLSTSGLKDSTIGNHLSNVDFYINDFLLYDDLTPAKDGIPPMSSFFNWFFPRKAMWSSPAATKSNAASFKKFYKFLADKKIIDIVDYELMLLTIKTEMPDWQSHYNEEVELW